MDYALESRPVWGAWIEILLSLVYLLLSLGRAPYGARGLKSLFLHYAALSIRSRPVWGAWIEMQLWPRRDTRCR